MIAALALAASKSHTAGPVKTDEQLPSSISVQEINTQSWSKSLTRKVRHHPNWASGAKQLPRSHITLDAAAVACSATGKVDGATAQNSAKPQFQAKWRPSKLSIKIIRECASLEACSEFQSRFPSSSGNSEAKLWELRFVVLEMLHRHAWSLKYLRQKQSCG